jgi:arylsulfatase A-like enzyme
MLRRELLGGAALSAALAGQKKAAGRPNVIVLLSDDQGYGDFSCHGNPVLKTPHLDRLSKESARLTDFHVAPMCTPTRGQLMSGRDALRNGATSVTAGRAVLRRGIPTMANVFRDGGYATGIFGKWHLGDQYPFRPMERGFQRAVYHLGWGFSSAPEFDNDYFNGRYQDQGVEKRFAGYCTDFWFAQAMEWMAAQQKERKPFFCYLPTNTPHAPNWVDEKYAAPYRQAGLPAEFFGMIANLDENVGKLEEFLQSSGLREDTIFVFFTDNGGTQGVRYFNAGMRSGKTTLYNGGHRVPCWIRWQSGRVAATDIGATTQVQDLLPTLAELAGLQKHAALRSVDGVSVAGLLRGEKKKLEPRTLVVQYGQTPKKWDSCVIRDRWHLVQGRELYNLDADEAQKKDVAMEHPQVVESLRAHYEQWWNGVEAKVPVFEALSIGAPEQNPTMLTSSDWQDIYSDNVGHVSNVAGGPRGGAWSVLVERSGDYEVDLYRWPPHLQLALTAGRAAQKLTAGVLPVGKAVPVAAAALNIGGQRLAAEAKPGAASVRFTLKLQAGQQSNLQGWFRDAAGNDLCGAFYAVVRRA